MVKNLTTPPVAARRQCGHTVLHKTAADTQCECTRLTCRWSCRLCAIDGSQRDVLTVGDISTWTKDNKCEAPTCRRMGMPPAGHGSIVMQHHGLAQDSLKSLHVPACYEGLVAPASGGSSTCAHMLLSGTDLHKTAGHPPARRTSTGGWQQQRCWLPWCLAPPTGKEEIQPVACLLQCGLQPKAAAAAQSAVCLLQRCPPAISMYSAGNSGPRHHGPHVKPLLFRALPSSTAHYLAALVAAKNVPCGTKQG